MANVKRLQKTSSVHNLPHVVTEVNKKVELAQNQLTESTNCTAEFWQNFDFARIPRYSSLLKQLLTVVVVTCLLGIYFLLYNFHLPFVLENVHYYVLIQNKQHTNEPFRERTVSPYHLTTKTTTISVKQPKVWHQQANGLKVVDKV